MKTNHDQIDNTGYDQCTLILKQEIELLEKIGALQLLVKNAVVNREWADFEGYLQSLSSIGGEFEALDIKREQLFSAFALQRGFKNESAGFYSFVARLPEPERKELTEIYRTLKMKTLEAQFANDSLTDYLNEARTLVSGFLEAVYPQRKGRLYSRQGVQVAPDMRSMVLNQSL